MALTWSGRRQLLYYVVGAAILFVLSVIVWQVFFAKAATCLNGALDGDERGVDCGGSCALICSADAKKPVVLFARAFQISPSTYTAAAYVENNNLGAGAHKVKYSFRLFDKRNVLVVERVGTMSFPPVPLVPVIEANINIGNRDVAQTQFAFSDDEIQWVKNTRVLPNVRATQQKLSSDGSRLSVVVVNDSIEDVRNLTIAAVLFDGGGVARAASKSTIPLLSRRSSQDVMFTWGSGVPNVQKYDITILPEF